MASANDLATIPLFSPLSDSDVRKLAAWFDVQTASPGVCLIGEGAAGYSFFVLTQGNAVVTSEGATLATLGPGDFFGEVAILGNGRRSATVTTTAPSTLLVMFGTEFRQLQAAHPEIAHEIQEAMRRHVAARN